ncbi:MAG: hypothetical protein GY700_12485 [Propionibacteriaceae bacterium]|nr:hypothetical protein [Propionibacteriaceae bacterium]
MTHPALGARDKGICLLKKNTKKRKAPSQVPQRSLRYKMDDAVHRSFQQDVFQRSREPPETPMKVFKRDVFQTPQSFGSGQ